MAHAVTVHTQRRLPSIFSLGRCAAFALFCAMAAGGAQAQTSALTPFTFEWDNVQIGAGGVPRKQGPNLGDTAAYLQSNQYSTYNWEALETLASGDLSGEFQFPVQGPGAG